MIDARILKRATVIGMVLQLLLVGAGHFLPWVAGHIFMFGLMMISAGTGYCYALFFGRGFAVGALGGAIAGGLCVVPAIGLAVLIDDQPITMLALATGVCILTGGVGGVFGQIAATMRRMGW